MRILVSPDKFKGSLTAIEAAHAIQRGLVQVWPSAEITLAPVADGGEGTAEAVHCALGGEWIRAEAHDPLGRVVGANYLWITDISTAVIEMSAASGLWRLAVEERDPLIASTRGTGELMLDAIRRGAKRLVVGLGGSATNDGGIGMAAALGYRFLTSDGDPLEPIPANLLALTSIRMAETVNLPQIVAACDVRNPLLGKSGATAVYGGQKGADTKAKEFLESANENLAEVVSHDMGCDFRHHPGAGAAGGLGFGLMTFCNAVIRPGFEVVAEYLELEEAVSHADLVITGEGMLDLQTIEGKAPAGVATLARKYRKPVIAFAGMITGGAEVERLFDAVCPLAENVASLDDSIRNAANLLEQSALRTARLVQLGHFL